ncbi:hypothetical protein HZB01_02370 [Candidatus Woesearchaeota archaeon]|nr:hypothetical protein [Candidatus Woesearchaeota archaeon]
MVAVGIFLVVVIIFVLFISYINNASASKELKAEGETISGKLTAKDSQNPCAFIDSNNQVLPEKMTDCYNLGYNASKDVLNVKNDYCFYMEDEDGNILDLDTDPADGISLYGIGQPGKVTFNITLQDGSTLSVGCGQRVCGNVVCP